MPEPKQRGGKRPNTGGKRVGAGRKSKTGRTERLTISIRPDLKQAIENSGRTPTEFIEAAILSYLKANLKASGTEGQVEADFARASLEEEESRG